MLLVGIVGAVFTALGLIPRWLPLLEEAGWDTGAVVAGLRLLHRLWRVLLGVGVLLLVWHAAWRWREVIGEPVSLPDAKALAKQDPYQFQWWALGLVGARPVEKKKGADEGIDGRLFFHDEAKAGKTKHVILSVKAGRTSVAHVRDLRGVVEREKAEMGVLVTMQEPTKAMRTEAAKAMFYDSPGWKTRHPRMQVLTVAELLKGKGIDMPPVGQVSVTFKKAPKVKEEAAEQLPLDE